MKTIVTKNKTQEKQQEKQQARVAALQVRLAKQQVQAQEKQAKREAALQIRLAKQQAQEQEKQAKREAAKQARLAKQQELLLQKHKPAIKPVLSLEGLPFVQEWVKNSIPDEVRPPLRQKYSHGLLYVTLRDVAGEQWYEQSVPELYEILIQWAKEHPDTPVGKYVLTPTPQKKRDITHRIHWVMGTYLAKMDSWQ